jgi:hypothetical protein
MNNLDIMLENMKKILTYLLTYSQHIFRVISENFFCLGSKTTVVRFLLLNALWNLFLLWQKLRL